MNHGKPEGQQEEETDKQHGNQMRQPFVLHPGDLLVVIGQQLEKFIRLLM